MKQTILYPAIFAVLLCTIVSCKDWFEVSPSARATQEDLFKDHLGFETAVNGVYRLMSSPALYGKELTWGLLSVISQNYERSRLYSHYAYVLDGAVNSGSAEARLYVDPIWEQGYNVIANCNNVIAHTEQRSPDFFKRGQVDKDMILGEMRGIRGLMHLQILQLFAPPVILDDGEAYMPYVTRFPEHQPEFLTITQVLDKVIEDLDYSQRTLASVDTVHFQSWNTSVLLRFEAEHATILPGTYYSFRGTRMNFFAAKALLARAYLWKGDKARALQTATEVYAYCRYSTDVIGESSARPWYSYPDMTSAMANLVPRKLHSDLLLAFHNPRAYEIFYDDYFAPIGWTTLVLRDKDNIFKKVGTGTLETSDWRYSRLIDASNRSMRWQRPDDPAAGADVINYQGPLLPVIRMSEMAHIIAECDPVRGRKVMYLTRYYRGIQGGGEGQLVEGEQYYLDAVLNDIIRETMTEGRAFFDFKRLNKPINLGGTQTMDMKYLYVIDPPKSQTSYATH